MTKATWPRESQIGYPFTAVSDIRDGLEAGEGEPNFSRRLHIAVFRPQSGYYEDPIAEAAALLESLIQNHPILDGSKRTALAAADVHLRMNGFELGGDSMEHHEYLIRLMEAADVDGKMIERWLRNDVDES